MALIEQFDRPINNNPVGTKRLAFGDPDSPIENIELDDFYVLLVEKLGVIPNRVIEIGNWDMDNDDRVFITPPIASSKIISVSALIRADADTDANPRRYDINCYEGSMGGGCIVYDNDIVLTRPSASMFNSTLFHLTSFNRGWITIEYIP